MKTCLQLLLYILLSASCKKNITIPALDEASKESTESIVVGGRTRSYIQYLPSGLNKIDKAPLVFLLHGGGGDGAGINSVAKMKEIAEREKFIIIFPDGVEKSWNDGRPSNANALGVNDVKFFDELITKLSAAYKIDSKKVYTVGISNGGFMSMRLACELSSSFAAAASVAATIERDIVAANCTPSNKVSVMLIHGTLDGLVPFTGGFVTTGAGGNILSHFEAVNKWVSVNNCTATPVITDLPDIVNDGTTIKKRVYANGTNNTEVVSYVVNGGGHTWPGGLQYAPVSFIGVTSMDMNASEEIWKFFKTHAKP
jgi:polyhydroxybutyrate depolymerase